MRSPQLVAVDMAQQERLGLRAEQGAGGELVVEARHRHAMLRDTAEDGPMRHAQGRQTERARGAVDRCERLQQIGQLLPNGLRRGTGTDRGCDHRLVDRGGTQVNSASRPDGT
jgi:hypothetical protein